MMMIRLDNVTGQLGRKAKKGFFEVQHQVHLIQDQKIKVRSTSCALSKTPPDHVMPSLDRHSSNEPLEYVPVFEIFANRRTHIRGPSRKRMASVLDVIH